MIKSTVDKQIVAQLLRLISDKAKEIVGKVEKMLVTSTPVLADAAVMLQYQDRLR